MLLYNVPCTKAETVNHQETSISVRSAVPITSNLSLNDFRFESLYVVSLIYSKTTSGTTLRIPESTFKFSHINCSVKDVRIFDNLNNSFQVNDDGATITNKEIEVNIPASFEYNFSLSLTSQTEIFFDGVSYVLPVNINPPPDVLTIKFPRNYTIRETSPMVPKETTNEFIVLTWQKAPIVTVKFLPFILQFTLTSTKGTFEIASVFPTKAQVSLTEERTFTVPRKFSVWDITPFISMSYDFPPYIENVEVVKVWDGIGQCNEIHQYVLNPTANEAGTYYVDYKNRVLYVYPRYNYKGEFYQYLIGYEITSSPNVESLQATIIFQEPYMPYRFESSCVMFLTDSTYDWKIGFTETPTLKFILPEKSEVVYDVSGKPLIGMETNRPTATYFIDYSPSENSTYVLFVTYEIAPLRFYFWLAIGFIASFMVLIIVTAVWYARNKSNASRHRKTELGTIATISGLFLTTNIASFQSLGGYNATFVTIFLITIVFWLSFTIFYFFGRRLFHRKPSAIIKKPRARLETTKKPPKSANHPQKTTRANTYSDSSDPSSSSDKARNSLIQSSSTRH